jgi:hypothetical protein
MVLEMFGDVDTDAEDMRRRSPVTYADQITGPLRDRRLPAQAPAVVSKAVR